MGWCSVGRHVSAKPSKTVTEVAIKNNSFPTSGTITSKSFAADPRCRVQEKLCSTAQESFKIRNLTVCMGSDINHSNNEWIPLTKAVSSDSRA